MSKRQQLYNLLYEWFASETCTDCQHMETYVDGDGRHPCARCDCYEKYKVCNAMKEDIKDKVQQIIDIWKKNKK